MKRLKKEFQALANVFSNHYEDRGCCCHQCPPCGYCTHPGHPDNLAEDHEAWIEMLEPMCEGQEQILLGDDTPALQDGDMVYVLQTDLAVIKCKMAYSHMRFRAEDKYIGIPMQCAVNIFGGVA